MYLLVFVRVVRAWLGREERKETKGKIEWIQLRMAALSAFTAATCRQQKADICRADTHKYGEAARSFSRVPHA